MLRSRFLVVTLTLGWSLPLWASTAYVQAIHATVRAEAKASAASVTELSRGDQVETAETQGFWTKVSVNGKSGWITKLSLGDKKPVGQSTLVDAGKLSEAKASRERVKSPTLAASSRGLSNPDVRMRGNQSIYKVDMDAVKKMDTQQVSDSNLDKFINDAKLSP